MRHMVGLVRRRGIFYYRRTIPEPLRADMPAVIACASPGVFDESASVTLKGSRAGREFWVSLRTRDPVEAHAKSLRLEDEAQSLINLAERRRSVQTKPKMSHIDDHSVEMLVATFRHRKLAADEGRRRGHRPLSHAEFDSLGREIAAREADLRDANARGDCTATHFDFDAMMTVLEAGLNLEFGSSADRTVYLAFVEAELDLLSVIRDRHAGSTRHTLDFVATVDHVRDAKRSISPLPDKYTATVAAILNGWQHDHQPREKTVYTFSNKIERWLAFLDNRGATFHSATLSDASDWKMASLVSRSAKSVSNDIYAVKAIYSWAVANGKCQINPFVGLKHPRESVRNKGRSSKRGFTDEEAANILLFARGRQGYRRWAPWIACFTGARITEICQLERGDIKNSSGIHYFDMTTEDEDEKEASDYKGAIIKSLKTSGSKRRIPIHPKLIEEGLLEFVANHHSKYLFDDATPDRFGSRGGNATKVLSRWVRQVLKITDVAVSPNHSFRHRFSTLCNNNKIPPEIRDRIMGHSSGEVREIYGDGYSISVMFEEICKIPIPGGLNNSRK